MGRIKFPRHKLLLNGTLKNDLEYVDAASLRKKIHEQSRFSILYFVLLITSVIVCTLGLLTNSTAIVIGGMLIAPLMWPLARVGVGIAHRAPHHLYRGFLLVIISVVIGAVSAYLMTSISPIKVINEEILARTSPTLMDLFIALAAGLVAAIAITQRKIVDSLAGVAIAASLMPPLCTVGIALSLNNMELSLGALLLFAVNAVCITLVTTVVFILTQFARKERVRIATKAMVVNLIFVGLLAIPLVQFLRNYSVEVQSYNTAIAEMQEFIEGKDPAAEFENVLLVQSDKDTYSVQGDLLIPSEVSFTYEDNEALIRQLEIALGRKVLLNIKIQNTIEPITKNQQDNEKSISTIQSLFSEELLALSTDYRISAISITQNEDDLSWNIVADVLSSPDSVPLSSVVDDMSSVLTEKVGQPVAVNVTFVPRLTLRSSEQSSEEEAQKAVDDITTLFASGSLIEDFTVTRRDAAVSVAYTVTSSQADQFADEYLSAVRSALQSILGSSVSLQVRLVQSQTISL